MGYADDRALRQCSGWTGRPYQFFWRVIVGFAALLGQSLSAQEIDPYADEPDWYKPGHPLEPAEPASIETLEGFAVSKAVTVPAELGSISAMTTDPEGALIVGMQHKPGLYRVSLEGAGALEPLGGVADTIGWTQGLLWAFDSLYVTVAEKNDDYRPGLYRLVDTNSDGKFDEAKQLFEFRGMGEHGPHGLVVGPEGDRLYMICGNGTPVLESFDRRRTLTTEGSDHLMQPGFGDSQFSDAGWVFSFQPDGEDPELIAGGLRNSYDLAFNRDGELFTFDSDMEYDLGAPWYRPTRICHLVSGAEFGWRASAAKWPEWYEDSVGSVVDIGPSSPTGVVFGYETNFPGRYRDAFYVLDWTYATVYAVHLTPKGATYTGEIERFTSGIGLPLTDAAIGGDGSLYFSVGGRRLGSAIYRIRYTGDDTTHELAEVESTGKSARNLRQRLERFHGSQDSTAIDSVWPYLRSSDRSLRFAARVALEWQPTDHWKERAFAEQNATARLNALIALARQGNDAELKAVLGSLTELNWGVLNETEMLMALRVAELVLSRGGLALKSEGASIWEVAANMLPHDSVKVNRELARLLSAVNYSKAIDPLLDLMESDQGRISFGGLELVGRNLKYATPILNMTEAPPMEERLHIAQSLNWVEDGWSDSQRKRYFELTVDAIQNSRGGNGYQTFWKQTLDTARSGLSDVERQNLASIWAPLETVEEIPKAEGPGRIWTLDYLVDRISEGFGSRDYANGKRMYAAASCNACHGMGGEGGMVGPELSSIGQRFTVRDLLDSIIHPSRAIADQYQMMILSLENGETVTGRILSKDSRNAIVAHNAMNPTETRTIPIADISSLDSLPASTMPPDLLNALNEDEVLDLIAYLVAGGRADHALFKGREE